MRLVGYADQLSAAPGTEVSFMVSSAHEIYAARLVRLIHGDVNAAGPGFKAQEVPCTFSGDHPGEVQPLCLGSYISVPDMPPACTHGDFTVQMWICPTTPDRPVQTLIAHRDGGSGFSLRLDHGTLTLEIGHRQLRSERVVQRNCWYFVAAAYDATTERARLVLERSSGVILETPERTTGTLRPAPAQASGKLLLAAEPSTSAIDEHPRHFYNGKIDAPRIYDRALSDAELAALRDGSRDEIEGGLAAAWDFSQGISSWTVIDVSGNERHGVAVNKPTRAVTGHNWDGSETAWLHALEQYGAIHFHEDDLADARWRTAWRWTVPDELPSGVYAAHLSANGDEDFIPFIVTPTKDHPQAAIALILPTFSYLAYGNEQMAADGTLKDQVDNYPRTPEDAYIVRHGLRSLYDRHTDGSSVCYASWLRPIVNMRPKYTQAWLDSGRGSPHQLSADLHLVDWLVEHGYRFDVLTDLELHREGLSRLRDYKVVLTGTHAEYCSGEMIDGYQAYLNEGGRLMYLSGNGMFWVTQLDPDTGTSVEIRRRSAPVWTWPAAPGEAHLSSTGELGGLWSNRGRGAHAWLGVGMNAEGASCGRPFRRQPASFYPRAEFVFADIADDELIGDLPSLVNSWGAAGFEFDYASHEMGTPEHTFMLATAEGFSEAFELTAGALVGGAAQHPPVRADMVLLHYPNDGAVFSAGSITWSACLSANSYNNTVSRVTSNVLDGFLQDKLP